VEQSFMVDFFFSMYQRFVVKNNIIYSGSNELIEYTFQGEKIFIENETKLLYMSTREPPVICFDYTKSKQIFTL
jgi:hypothetical protein